MTWLTTTWAAVWPNLLASAIWAPLAFAAQHVLIRRHLIREHEQLRHDLTRQPGDSDGRA